MKRTVGALAVAGALLAVEVTTAGATDPSPCPTPTSASAARVTCPAAADPNQAAYDQLRTRLGGDLSTALTNEERLTAALHQTSTGVQILSDQIAAEEAVILTWRTRSRSSIRKSRIPRPGSTLKKSR